MSLKVPEVEKFYKLPDSRAVVEFRINTGFTASCFFGTLLVAFAQIKDSYISTRCSATTHSTCTVMPNWSTPRTLRISYPPSQRIFRSLPRVAESQLTYTMRSGCMRSMVFKQASSQPFRGGSTTMTSGWSISSEDASVDAFL